MLSVFYVSSHRNPGHNSEVGFFNTHLLQMGDMVPKVTLWGLQRLNLMSLADPLPSSATLVPQ